MTVHCEAVLNYVGESGPVPVTTPIINGRTVDLPRYDDCGFTFLEHASVTTDWSDAGELGEVHIPEVEELARELLGCDLTVPYPPLVRSPAAAAQIEDYAPIELVHSDFSEDYRPMTYEPHRPYAAFIGPRLAARGLDPAAIRDASRQALIQFWRNTGPVEADYPLAVCDARTVDPERRVKSIVENYGGERIEFELSTFTAPEEDRHDAWYTFPSMTVDEVLAFRTYDSRCVDEGRPFWTPHSAFRDPAVELSPATRRHSVEMRVMCLWR